MRTPGVITSDLAPVEATAPRAQPWRPGVAVAGLVGVVAMALAIGIAELLAAFGEWIGLLTPRPLPLSVARPDLHPVHPGVAQGIRHPHLRRERQGRARPAGMGITLLIVAAIIGIIGRGSPRIAVGITAGARSWSPPPPS